MVLDPQLVWNGLVVGSIIAVSALGLTLIFGILNFINIAYGDYMAAGAYVAWAVNAQIGLPLGVAIVAGILTMSVGAVVLDKIVFQHFRTRSPITLLIVSIGLAFIIRNFIRAIWGPSGHFYDLPMEANPSFAGVRFSVEQVAIMVVSMLLLLGVYLLLRRTRIGIAMRAASDDRMLSRIRGVDTEKLVLYVWLIGGAIAGLGGIMLGLDAQLRPNMGFTALIPIFAAVILGGIGDPKGAVAGGYTIGVAQEVSVAVIPSEYKFGVGLLALIVGLLTRPDGLFGEATR
ncbi:branched-chain amino acid ABC transporter permease [Haloplanus litoreus]|uniref:Branched-chain amino acid ABC transporter permease n=1 Tax=Haloplanus litoreus TaxID=767515 RepID=A0ABD5ZVV3_9EURY